MKVLIISFYFPPNAKVGAKRFAFLSEILDKYSIELHILTVKEQYIFSRDHSLNYAGTVHRTKMCPPFPFARNTIFKKILYRLWEDYLCVLDPYVGWVVPALLKGLNIAKTKNIDTIIASGPPFSPMVIAFLISIFSKTRLVLDYRDPWTNHRRKCPKVAGKRVNQVLEKRIVARASDIVFVTETMRNNFIDTLAKNCKASLHVVPNGYHKRSGVPHYSLGSSRKNMLYAGNFYGDRTLHLIARSLSLLLKKQLITERDFCFHIFGRLKDKERRLVNKYELHSIIEEHHRVPYDQILKYMIAADILFLPSGSSVSYAVPFKFYDYLSVRRPILAIAPSNSALAQIMRELNCGEFASIDDENAIYNKLYKMISTDVDYTYCGTEDYKWDKIGKKYIYILSN